MYTNTLEVMALTVHSLKQIRRESNEAQGKSMDAAAF